MARRWARRLGKAAVVALLLGASAVAVVVWRPRAERLKRPPPDLQVGKTAPNIPDQIEAWVQGDVLDLKAFRGRAVLLFFWHPRDDGRSEPWLPEVVRLARAYEGKGLVTVGLCVVDLEDAAELIQPLIQRYGIPFRMALDCDADLHLAYGIDKKGTPYCYLVGKNRRIRWGGHPEFLTQSDLEHALGAQ